MYLKPNDTMIITMNTMIINAINLQVPQWYSAGQESISV